MKKQFYLSFIFSFQLLLKLNAQCESSNILFTYQVSESQSTIDVTFVISPQYSCDYCKKIYVWDFGDGSEIKIVEKYYDDQYTYETHSYDKSDPTLFNNGQFEVDVVLYSNFYLFDNLLQCTLLNCCFEYHELITQPINSSGYTLAFYLNPNTSVYPKGEGIDFIFELTHNDPASFNNASYIFEIDGQGDDFSKIASIMINDFNHPNTIFSWIPDSTGSYFVSFKLLRYEAILEQRSFNINVADGGGGDPPPNRSCQYFGERPKLGLSYTINDKQVKFTLIDSSSEAFRNVYGMCAKYRLFIDDGVGRRCLIPSQECSDYTKGETYPYAGFNDISYTAIRNDVLGSPYLLTFWFVLDFEISGTPYYTRVNRYATIFPKDFNQTENNIDISPEGDTVFIETYTNECKHTIMENLNNPSDNLDWIENFSLYNDIAFRIDPNFDDIDRELSIKLFVNGNYDKCLSVVNGEKMNYRLIKVHQPTKLINMASDTIEKIPLPANTIPQEIRDQASYYSISPGSAGESNAYFRNEDYLPLDAIYEICDGGFLCNLTLYAYDENNQPIWSQVYSVYNCICNQFIITNFLTADIVLINRSGGYVVSDNITAREGKFLGIFAEDYVTLNPGFYTEDGAYFIADTKPCATMSAKTESNLPSIPYTYDNVSDHGNSLELIPVNIDNGIRVYPNPNTGIFIVDLSNSIEKIVKIDILNISGPVVFQKTDRLVGKIHIDLNFCAEGIYILRSYKADGKMYFNKIIIE